MKFETEQILFWGEVFAAVSVVFAYDPYKQEELGATRISIPMNIENQCSLSHLNFWWRWLEISDN